MTQCNETRPAGHVIEVCLRDTGHEGAHRYISDPPPDDVRDLRSKLANLEAENGRLREEKDHWSAQTDKWRGEASRYYSALVHISEIRDSIVGMQGFNFSEHAYPLVAILDGLGIKGAGYEVSEKERDEARAALERAAVQLDAFYAAAQGYTEGTPAEVFERQRGEIERLTARAYPLGAELHCEQHGYFDGRVGCAHCFKAALLDVRSRLLDHRGGFDTPFCANTATIIQDALDGYHALSAGKGGGNE